MEDHTTNLKEIQYFKLWKCPIFVTSLSFFKLYYNFIKLFSAGLFFGFLIKLELYQNVLILTFLHVFFVVADTGTDVEHH